MVLLQKEKNEKKESSTQLSSWDNSPYTTHTHTHTHTLECYSAIKKNEILPFATTWMDLEGIMLSVISQTEKDKYHMISLICGI